MQAVSLEPTGMNAPNSLAVCSHAAACLREPAKLRNTIAAMEPLPGRWLQRQLRSARAAVDALDSHVDDAVAAYHQLFEEWLHDDLPLDHAWGVVDALAVLPENTVAAEAVEQARSSLTALAAKALLVRLESAAATVSRRD